MHTCKTKSLRMKNLFFVAVAIGIFSGISNTATAQTSVKLEGLANRIKPKTSLKFIENIEITPEKNSDNLVASSGVERTVKPMVSINVPNNGIDNIEECSAIQFKYAMIMNKEVETFNNASLYNFINEWWATRYYYGGTDKHGIDCSAFTGKILSSVYGIAVPRTAVEQYKISERVSREELTEGDLVFFNTRGGVSHVGFYLGDNYFVHSSVAYGVTISSLTDDYYNRKYIGGGRICK